ncbi:MAG: hypothetical protein R3301_13990, partial [Saprospiraceae bacterium]|nr:hypothetical protein [Saprospiraceae bacterium]
MIVSRGICFRAIALGCAAAIWICCADQNAPSSALVSNDRPGSFLATDSSGDSIAPADYIRVWREDLHPDSVRNPAKRIAGDRHRIQPIRFEKLTAADGLPHNTIRGLHVDAEGYLWIAYGSGLIRYDGYDFVYLDEAKPMYPDMGRIMEDGEGNIWIASGVSEDVRLYRAADGTLFKLTLFPETNQLITRLREDRHGRIMILSLDTTSFFLHTFDPAGMELPADTHVVDPELTAPLVSAPVRIPETFGEVADFIPDEQDLVWLISQKGLVRFDPDAGQFDRVLPDPSPFFDNQVIADGNGSLWYGAPEGIVEYNTRAGKAQSFPFP